MVILWLLLMSHNNLVWFHQLFCKKTFQMNGKHLESMFLDFYFIFTSSKENWNKTVIVVCWLGQRSRGSTYLRSSIIYIANIPKVHSKLWSFGSPYIQDFISKWQAGCTTNDKVRVNFISYCVYCHFTNNIAVRVIKDLFGYCGWESALVQD